MRDRCGRSLKDNFGLIAIDGFDWDIDEQLQVLVG